jgi:hypothetical protein
MKPFEPGMSIMVPEDWQDASTYVLLGPAIADGRVTLVATLSRKVPDPDLRAHIDRMLKELGKLPQYALKGREAGALGGTPADVVTFVWKQPGGPLVRQRQWYQWKGGSVWTVTGTAPDTVFDRFAPQFAEMVQTFVPKSA